MAQLSSNSQGTAGLEDSGTRAALLQFIRETSAYATMLARALRELEWRREVENAEAQPTEVDIVQADTPMPMLPSHALPLLKGAERQALPYAEPLTSEVVRISRKEDLTITLQVGSYKIEEKYADIDERFSDLPLAKQQAIATAVTGGTPTEPVSIKVKDHYGNESCLSADPETNKGWTVANSPTQIISPQQIENDLQRQKTDGIRKLKDIMRELKPDGGPDMFRGKSLTVLTDGDEVIVVDVNSGVVRDVERLDKLGDIGLHAVREAAREAVGAFGIKGSAAQGVAPHHRTRKQRELTL